MVDEDAFADVVEANRAYAAATAPMDLPAAAAKGLAVLTCMDSRLDPLRMMGLVPGDAKILRNAGARVTEDVLRTLVLARYLLEVRRVAVVQHTRCRMASGTEADVHVAIAEAGGPDTASLSFLTTSDQPAAVREDVTRIRAWPYLSGLAAAGFIFDLDTGLLRRIC